MNVIFKVMPRLFHGLEGTNQVVAIAPPHRQDRAVHHLRGRRPITRLLLPHTPSPPLDLVVPPQSRRALSMRVRVRKISAPSYKFCKGPG